MRVCGDLMSRGSGPTGGRTHGNDGAGGKTLPLLFDLTRGHNRANAKVGRTGKI
jgi:hypothetical protein